MKPFDDRLPEEQDPQYEELITLLQHANLSPMQVDPTQRAQIFRRVRGRLMKTDSEPSLIEDISVDEMQGARIRLRKGKLLTLTEDRPVDEMQGHDSSPGKPKTRVDKQHRSGRLLHLFNNLAAVLVVAALIGSVLILKATLLGRTGGFPTMTLSSHIASPGSTVQVTLRHFSPSARVVLIHDIQVPILISGSSSITTDAQGSATFPLVIDTTWGPGFHLIVAKDVSSRLTASANLQITGEGITAPAHLLIDTTALALGADFVGTNTIRTLLLANSGGGSISWSANSDASWLLVAPSQGIFSQQEAISVAVQRIGLKPGDYHSRITISSSVSPPQHIEVDMSVRPLPPNAGPVLAVSPALLSFTASASQQNVSPQLLTVSNPGSLPLKWSLGPLQGLSCPWLSAIPASGSVPSGSNLTLTVNVKSECLLPGVYTGKLEFTANSVIDSSQAVNVSVVIQPHCGLVTSTGFLAFTVVAGQNTLAHQSLSLNATASCAGSPTPWSYSSTKSWLSVTPGSGQLKGTASSVVTASVNAGGLQPSPTPYYADLSFVFGQSTLTVVAQVTVQAAPPTAPIISASPLSLNFSNIQGQPDPTGQVVTITNTGHSPLNWHVTATPLPLFAWLAASPSGGIIAPGQAGNATIHVNTAQLTPGNYVAQISLGGMDAKGNPAPGSPQIITVNLVEQSPCTLSPPSSSTFSLSAVQGASTNPATQPVLFTATGSCVWPLSWKTMVAPAASWLTQTAGSGTIGGNWQSGSLGVTANITDLGVGTYSTTVTIVASDANGITVQGGTQTFTVTLTVTGFTINGTVFACADQTCATPHALAGATVTVWNGSTTVATTTADSSGKYSFSNMPLGRYTITVAGYDASNTHYVGSLSLTLTDNAPGTTIQVFPG
jgi:hypothetical protein